MFPPPREIAGHAAKGDAQSSQQIDKAAGHDQDDADFDEEARDGSH